MATAVVLQIQAQQHNAEALVRKRNLLKLSDEGRSPLHTLLCTKEDVQNVLDLILTAPHWSCGDDLCPQLASVYGVGFDRAASAAGTPSNHALSSPEDRTSLRLTGEGTLPSSCLVPLGCLGLQQGVWYMAQVEGVAALPVVLFGLF